jgi:hypothetical protein
MTMPQYDMTTYNVASSFTKRAVAYSFKGCGKCQAFAFSTKDAMFGMSEVRK